MVHVVAVNDTPVANAGPDRTTLEGAAIIFNGEGLSDVDGDSLTARGLR